MLTDCVAEGECLRLHLKRANVVEMGKRHQHCQISAVKPDFDIIIIF